MNSLNISKSTFYRITKHDLKWDPYKMREEKKERMPNLVYT